MSAFFKVAKREIERIFKRPIIVFSLFGLPIFFCIVLMATFSSGIPRDLPIAVADFDNSAISRQIVRMVDSTPACKVKYRIDDIQEGKDLLTGVHAYGFLLIPRDFSKDIKRGSHPQIVFYYNNQMILIGGIIDKDVNTAIQTALGGFDALIQMKKGLPKDIVLRKVNVIRVDEHIKGNPFLNYSYFLTYAAVAHTFQIIITFMAIWAVGIEFKEGTTKDWLALADNSIITAVFGKLFFYIICYLTMIFATYALYILLFGAEFEGNMLFLLFGTLCFILAYQLVGIAFVAVTSNLRFSFSSGAFYTSLGFTLAGMTFPSIGMPWFGRFYSALLPVRPYVALVIDQVMRGFKPHYDLIYIWWMLGLALLGFCFLPLLKIHAQDERNWFQL